MKFDNSDKLRKQKKEVLIAVIILKANCAHRVEIAEDNTQK